MESIYKILNILTALGRSFCFYTPIVLSIFGMLSLYIVTPYLLKYYLPKYAYLQAANLSKALSRTQWGNIFYSLFAKLSAFTTTQQG